MTAPNPTVCPGCGDPIIPAYSGPSGSALILDPQLQQGGYALQPSGSAYLTHGPGRAVHLEHDGAIQVVIFIRGPQLTVAPIGPVRDRVERLLHGRLSRPAETLDAVTKTLRSAGLTVHIQHLGKPSQKNTANPPT